ncbi:hypothetical protein LINGRAHAP2_LOCUS16448 [Linum grandiflorum]
MEMRCSLETTIRPQCRLRMSKESRLIAYIIVTISWSFFPINTIILVPMILGNLMSKVEHLVHIMFQLELKTVVCHHQYGFSLP